MKHHVSSFSFETHGKPLLLAFILALGLWYNVTGKEKVEVWVDVKVVYTNIPTDLTVVKGLEDKISVLVRTAKGLRTSLQGREHFIRMDLSNITRGAVEVPISKDQMPYFTGVYEVIDINPKKLQLTVEAVTEKTVPLNPVYGQLPPDIYVQNLTLKPSSVVLRGTARELRKFESFSFNMKVGDYGKLGPRTLECELIAPDSIQLSVNKVDVEFELAQRRKNITLNKEIAADVPLPFAARLSDGSATITVSVPASKAQDPEFLKSLGVMISLDAARLRAGTFTAQVRPVLPKDVELIKLDPTQINVVIVDTRSNKP